ncbi:hypothetical protein B0T40_24345 [Chromobacterium haemolyticum]|nr:hypothetical protein B0T40_24345 [Chromobacterium haemolyticum]
MRPQYNKNPIRSIDSLCDALRVSEVVLRHTAENIQHHYTPYSIPKANGKTRVVHIPSLHLKTIQKRINKEIFSHITYPDYLYGGIEGKDYVKNANAHAGANVLIALDVKDFYPSIKREHVTDVYQHLCNFSKDVAELLTDLTTLRERVPQGACTSSHLANLVLHKVEYPVVQNLRNQDFRYTRLLDDICISASKFLSPAKIETIISDVARMLKSKELRLHPKKKSITSKNNPESLMEVTGLWLNRGHARAKREERRAIRTEVYRCEKEAARSRYSPEYHKMHGSVSGRVAKLNYLHHPEAKNFRLRLQEILPLYDEHEIIKTSKIASVLSKVAKADRAKHWFAIQHHKAQYRVNIVGRTNVKMASKLSRQLSLCRPPKTLSELIYDEPI